MICFNANFFSLDSSLFLQVSPGYNRLNRYTHKNARLLPCKAGNDVYRHHSRSAATPATAAAPSSNAQAMAAAAAAVRERLEICVVAEAEEQSKQLERAYSRSTDKALLAQGIALIGVIGRAHGRLFGDFVWLFELATVNTSSPQHRAAAAVFPRHKFKAGSSVSIREMGSPRSDGLDATVLEVKSDCLVVTVSYQVAAELTRRSAAAPRSDRQQQQQQQLQLFRVEMGVNDPTTRRQLTALAQLSEMPDAATRQAKIVRAILLGSGKGAQLSGEPPEWMKEERWRQDAKAAIQALVKVNISQKAAIAAALTRTFTLIQGPPGTGKTRTLLAYLIVLCTLASVDDRQRQIGTILAVADTNAAADNLLEGLVEKGIDVVRVGRPAQVRTELRHTCLEAAAERSDRGQRAAQLRDQAATMMARVQEAAAAGRVAQREVQQAQREAQRLWAQADLQLAEASQAILQNCQVVVGTCSSAGEARLAGKNNFKVVAIDEATQSTEPSTLVALTKGAECVVMAGDQKQLPPTVLSRAAAQNGLGVTLFERLLQSGLPHLLLNTQYRMTPSIAAFPSFQFYSGGIVSGVTSEERPVPLGINWPCPQIPIAFIPCDFPEERASSGQLFGDVSSFGTSFRNLGQADVAIRAARQLLDGDPSLKSVAILTPYTGQATLLTARLQTEMGWALDAGRVLVSSVDGYQGREADAVVFTTVRSNAERKQGFLADERRMNVAITRARRALIVIGEPTTLETSAHWRAWLQWMKKNELVML